MAWVLLTGGSLLVLIHELWSLPETTTYLSYILHMKLEVAI